MPFQCKLCRSDRHGRAYVLAEAQQRFEAAECEDCGLFQVLYDWTAAPPPTVTLAYDTPNSDWVSDVEMAAHTAKAREFAMRLERTGRLSNATVLDIGCGHGHFLQACSQRGARHVVGHEFRRSSIDHAREQCNVHDVRSAPLDDRSVWPDAEFDVVCSFDVLEHVHDLQAFWDQCLRVLRPGGLLFHATPGSDSVTCRLGRVLSRLGAAKAAAVLCNIEPVLAAKDLDGGPHVHLVGRQQLDWFANRDGLSMHSEYLPSYSYSDHHYAAILPQLRWMPRPLGALAFRTVRNTVRNKLLFWAERSGALTQP